MSESNITGAGAAALTAAQQEALRWFSEHGGDGVLLGGNAVLAAGEVAPHTWGSFKALEAAGMAERYGKRRFRLTQK